MERFVDLIHNKKTGRELSDTDIQNMVRGYCEGSIPDYQMSAMLMAICFNGLSDRELTTLTLAMRDSGQINDLSSISGIKVDKHSTGGVGDKTTLIIGPIAAACDIPIAKMSGRGLGFTGGTIDKLESIPANPESDSSCCSEIIKNGLLLCLKPAGSLDDVIQSIENAVNIKTYEVIEDTPQSAPAQGQSIPSPQDSILIPFRIHAPRSSMQRAVR